MPDPKVTPELIAELRRLDAAASPGEWTTESMSEELHRWDSSSEVNPNDDECSGIKDSSGEEIVTTDSGYYGPNMPDARLIVAARNALPALLDRVERLEWEKQILRTLLAEAIERLEQKLDNVEALVRERDELRARVRELEENR